MAHEVATVGSEIGPALRELYEAGGSKRNNHCQFSHTTAHLLADLGWAVIEGKTIATATVRLTDDGKRVAQEL